MANRNAMGNLKKIMADTNKHTEKIVTENDDFYIKQLSQYKTENKRLESEYKKLETENNKLANAIIKMKSEKKILNDEMKTLNSSFNNEKLLYEKTKTHLDDTKAVLEDIQAKHANLCCIFDMEIKIIQGAVNHLEIGRSEYVESVNILCEKINRAPLADNSNVFGSGNNQYVKKNKFDASKKFQPMTLENLQNSSESDINSLDLNDPIERSTIKLPVFTEVLSIQMESSNSQLSLPEESNSLPYCDANNLKNQFPQ